MRFALDESHEDFASSIDALLTKANHFVTVAKERRFALITDAVTGRIDVSKVA